MPEIPSTFDELPLLKDLPLGTHLTITKAVVSKTEKNNYNAVTLDTNEHGRLFSLDAGVLNGLAKLTGNEELPAQKEPEFYDILEKGAALVSAKDPLVVVTSSYKSKKNNLMCATIKNAQ